MAGAPESIAAEGFDSKESVTDMRASVAALLRLAEVDARLAEGWLRQAAVMRRLDSIRRRARDAHDDLRATEIQIFFLESAPRCAAVAQALERLRSRCAHAQRQCGELALELEAESAESTDSQCRFAETEAELKSLHSLRRQIMSEAFPFIRNAYDSCVRTGRLPGVVPLEGRFCKGCGNEIRVALRGCDLTIPVLRPCPACGRVIYSHSLVL